MASTNINYIEFGATDLAATRTFYENAFDWSFTDYGPTYTAFTDGTIDGGFTTESEPGSGPLVILYTDQLDEMKEQIAEAGGLIVQDIYTFPGGRRFHFTDPSGNELAVWSDK